MTIFKKRFIRMLLIFGTLVPVGAFAHFIIFPQETRSMLVRYSGFKRQRSIYYNPSTPQNKIDSIQFLIQQATIRINNFWGSVTSHPKFIYCDRQDDLLKYASNPAAPAVTYVKLGAVIVLSPDAIDLDIISHEYSHAELYEHIGFFTFNYGIPSWFKHGLAMQNDYRDYYSEETLKLKSANFTHLPDIHQLVTDQQFYAGSLEQIMLNYMTAKHVVKNWYTKEKLKKNLKDLAAGQSFEESYHQ